MKQMGREERETEATGNGNCRGMKISQNRLPEGQIRANEKFRGIRANRDSVSVP
jgi:hypothetical protein